MGGIEEGLAQSHRSPAAARQHERVEIRPFEAADLPALSRLRATVQRSFSESDLPWYEAVWRWLESSPLADQMHRWVLASGGDVVGFLAAVPAEYQIGGSRIVAHTPTDLFVHPEYRFHTLTLLRAFFRSCPNCVTCDWLPTVLALQERFGAELAAELHHLGSVLDVSALSRRAPRPLVRVANLGLRGFRSALAALSGSKARVEAVEGFDSRFDDLFANVAPAVTCLPVKDAAFLRWRYGAGSPQRPSQVLAVPGAGGLLGYTVLRVTSGGRDGYVMDLVVRPGRYDVARALLRRGLEHLAAAGTGVVRYRFLPSTLAPRPADALRLGFLPRRQRHRLLVKLADPGLQSTARRPGAWAYSAGDGELSFWVR